ncbi:FAD:protein FMN transferase [Oceanospirillum sediminis]|uniref:FAD:protein FMN transferase n=1 Tax=Oceanospirillum sediminis TaxID=2760088 RepID=A0A839INW4_9GAMM|nr:FAD:protein FMN transferase [Oceanospirillum sediminis]MBB1487183.1 FAD:protein FMN transferase [Oceanospirillum sediminis]
MQTTPLTFTPKENPCEHPAAELSRPADYFLLQFQAMGGNCELMIDLPDSETGLAEQLSRLVVCETWRIEFKYSRYQKDNWHDHLHKNRGQWIDLDKESARLLAFADQGWQLSDGLFDITSGVLRKAWQFDGSDSIPDHDEISPLLSFIGWQRVLLSPAEERPDGTVKPARIHLPEDTELDLGGIGKEYAVDRVLGLAMQYLQEEVPDKPCSLLINLDGDIACSGPRIRADDQPAEGWKVAIASMEKDNRDMTLLNMEGGALASSGDNQRYLLKEGKRYGHLLNPKTGWPVENAARSVTVAAPTCTQSGLIASLALLQGEKAEEFLQRTGLKYWIEY